MHNTLWHMDMFYKDTLLLTPTPLLPWAWGRNEGSEKSTQSISTKKYQKWLPEAMSEETQGRKK